MKKIKRIVSLGMICAFLLVNIIAYGQSSSYDNCKSYTEEILSRFISAVKDSNAAEEIAALISKFVSGEGKQYLIDAFEKLSSGPGAAQRLKDVLGLDETAIENLLSWMAGYPPSQSNEGQSWFVSLVNGTVSLDVAAGDFVNKLIEIVGDVSKAEYLLKKVRDGIIILSYIGNEYKPIIYDEKENKFYVYDHGVYNLIDLLNTQLTDPIESADNKLAIRDAFQIIVDAVNLVGNEQEKVGAKLVLDSLGLIYTEVIPTPTPTETPAPTPTATPTETPAPTPTATPTETPAPTPTATPTETPAPTPTATPTETPTPTPTATPTETPTPTPTATPTETPAPTPTATPTETPTPTPTATPTETPTPTPTATPTETPTPTPTATPTETPTPTPTATPTLPIGSPIIPGPIVGPVVTPEPTASVTPTPTVAPTETPVSTPVPKPTVTPKPTPEVLTIPEILDRMDETSKSGDIDTFVTLSQQLANKLASEKDANNAVDIFEKVSQTIVNAIDKFSNTNQVKSIIDNAVNIANAFDKVVQNSSLSAVQKTVIYGKTKNELYSIFVKAFAISAVVPKMIESEDSITYSVDSSFVADALSKTSYMSTVAGKIKNAAFKNLINMISGAVPVGIMGDKEANIVIEKDAIEKINGDSKITGVLLTSKNFVIFVPKSAISSDKVVITVSPTTISDAVSQAVAVSISAGDEMLTKVNPSLSIVLILNKKIDKETNYAAYSADTLGTGIVPGNYAKALNSFIVNINRLGSYIYIGNYSKTYKDVDSKAWYFEYVQLVSAKGITEGYLDGTFKPQKNVTRAEFAKMIVQAFQFDVEDQEVTKFKDVKKTDWFYPYVATLYNLGIVNGRSATQFAPNAPITREEMTKIIAMVLLKTGKISNSTEAKYTFTDNDQIAEWAKGYVSTVVENGIMEGRANNAFAPKSNATRAETAAVIMRAFLK
ncbi:S-layer homology domain-containing protein [Caldicellulosiruptor morganii]|uniref:S-layer homology domain-containing protein n=1 Tax=Caldicellulosiruptor morganii TaxID=1387555 RepID=A0ABY7BQF8_9FIRM|nr:S-layer homology domain-containing protein [Caldicellulosiruptor morganii]WAM33654.1 S-layer homology domain-containing protein [Caldicellulosiruptor morganii]